jgi:hypothetical protein
LCIALAQRAASGVPLKNDRIQLRDLNDRVSLGIRHSCGPAQPGTVALISLPFHTTCPSANPLAMARRPTHALGSASELQPLLAGRLSRPPPSAGRLASRRASRLVRNAFSATVMLAATVNATHAYSRWNVRGRCFHAHYLVLRKAEMSAMLKT